MNRKENSRPFVLSPKLQAVYLFPQILKTDFQRDRRKSVFACWWLLPPNPFSQNSILRLRTVPALFLPSPAEIFCKRRGWLTSIIAYCPVNGNGIFSKIRQARRAAASVKRCSKGLGCYPNKQKLRFPATPGTAVSSLCGNKDTACQVAKVPFGRIL